jgi:PAS domain S-box-containing protein
MRSDNNVAEYSALIERTARKHRLTLHEKTILLKVMDAGLTYPHIASVLSGERGKPVSPAAVKHTLNRVMAKLGCEPRTRSALIQLLLEQFAHDATSLVVSPGTPPIPSNEAARLRALYSYNLLDTLPDTGIDTIVRLAAVICGTPISLMTLLDSDRQWFKSRVGLGVAETPRDIAFCAHALDDTKLMVVPDAFEDPRFAQNPLVTSEPKIRFYAGAPLTTPDGYTLGTLCVIDRVPRVLTSFQLEALGLLAEHVMLHINQQRRLDELETSTAAWFDDDKRRDPFFDLSPDLAAVLSSDGRLKQVNAQWESVLGYDRETLLKRSFASLVHPEDLENVLADMQRLYEGEQLRQSETRFIHANGAHRCLQWRAVPARSEGLFYVTARDITDQKSAGAAVAAALQEMERRAGRETAHADDQDEALHTLIDSLLPAIARLEATKPSAEQRKVIEDLGRFAERLAILLGCTRGRKPKSGPAMASFAVSTSASVLPS